MAETLSSEARKHVTRGRPRKSAPDQVTAEISDTPPVCSPPAPPPVQVHWNELGKTFGKLAAPFYDALGAAQPDPVLWEGFGLAWGQVVEYYVPTFRAGPIPAAVAMTAIVTVPLIVAYPAWRQRQREAEQKKKAEAARGADAELPRAA